MATATIYLDDTTLDNGCLEVVPGSHRAGRHPTRTDTDVFGNLEMDPAANAHLERVPVELPAGSVVLFGAFLAHATGPEPHRHAAAGPCSTATSPPRSRAHARRAPPPPAAVVELSGRDAHAAVGTSAAVPKIGDVARAAGVSPATVSRVLNGTGTVAPERAAAVRRAARELGYTPSGPARALRQQQARRVGRHHRRHREPVLHRHGARDRGRGPQRGPPPRAVQLRRGRRQGGGLRRHRAGGADGRRRDRGRLRQGVAPRRAARSRRARRRGRPPPAAPSRRARLGGGGQRPRRAPGHRAPDRRRRRSGSRASPARRG